MLAVALVHVPVEAVTRCPTCDEPEIAGNPVFTGGRGFATTTPVAFEKAEVLPTALVAMTVARTVMPTWPAPSRRLDPVMPARFVHTVFVAVQLCHWYVNVIG